MESSTEEQQQVIIIKTKPKLRLPMETEPKTIFSNVPKPALELPEHMKIDYLSLDQVDEL